MSPGELTIFQPRIDRALLASSLPSLVRFVSCNATTVAPRLAEVALARAPAGDVHRGEPRPNVSTSAPPLAQERLQLATL